MKKTDFNTEFKKINDGIIYFNGKNLFEQNFLQFKSAYEYFKIVTDSAKSIDYVYSSQSDGLDGLMNTKISAVGTNTNNDRAPILDYNDEIELQFRKIKF